MSNINRRRFERVEVNKTVVLKNGTKGRVRDLSAGGVSIVLDGPPKGRPGATSPSCSASPTAP